MTKLYASLGIVLCIIIGVQAYDSYTKEHKSPCIDTLASAMITSRTEKNGDVFFDLVPDDKAAPVKASLASTTPKEVRDQITMGKHYKICGIIE